MLQVAASEVGGAGIFQYPKLGDWLGSRLDKMIMGILIVTLDLDEKEVA